MTQVITFVYTPSDEFGLTAQYNSEQSYVMSWYFREQLVINTFILFQWCLALYSIHVWNRVFCIHGLDDDDDSLFNNEVITLQASININCDIEMVCPVFLRIYY